MTQRKNADPDSLSNYFDRVLEGIGHRGSSFTDVDALTHDERTDRYLFQEFKQAEEALNRGQARLLKGLARRDFITVWCVRRRTDGFLDWCDVATRTAATIGLGEYQRLYRCWWNCQAIKANGTAVTPLVQGDDETLEPITADDIHW